jgi:hypothetical protein
MLIGQLQDPAALLDSAKKRDTPHLLALHGVEHPYRSRYINNHRLREENLLVGCRIKPQSVGNSTRNPIAKRHCSMLRKEERKLLVELYALRTSTRFHSNEFSHCNFSYTCYITYII